MTIDLIADMLNFLIIGWRLGFKQALRYVVCTAALIIESKKKKKKKKKKGLENPKKDLSICILYQIYFGSCEVSGSQSFSQNL